MCGARDQWHVASDCFFHKHWCWHWGLLHLVAMKPAKWEWNGFKPPAKMFDGWRTMVVGNGVYNGVDYYWCLVPSDHLGSTASKTNGKVDHQSRRYSRGTVLRRNGTYSIGIQCLLHVLSHLSYGLISGSVDIHLLTVDSWSVPNALASMVNFFTLSNTATSPIEWHIYVIFP